MKDIKTILEGFDISDDVRDSIIREVTENYRTIAEVENKTQRIADLEKQNEALTEQVGNLEGEGEELEKLRDQVREFTEAEEKRKADETERAKRDSFRVLFDAAVGEREFANDIIRDSIFDKAYSRCSENTGFDAKDAIAELTKDTEGIWRNPQNDPRKMPNPNDLSNNKDRKAENDEKTIAAFMFGKRQ